MIQTLATKDIRTLQAVNNVLGQSPLEKPQEVLKRSEGSFQVKMPLKKTSQIQGVFP